jgi:hypothetical protein
MRLLDNVVPNEASGVKAELSNKPARIQLWKTKDSRQLQNEYREHAFEFGIVFAKTSLQNVKNSRRKNPCAFLGGKH